MLEPKDEIRQKLDVVDVVQDYLPLKPAGSGSFKGLCPFHAEKTPSLHVSRERQIWHCFGCDKGGDIFAFVMEMEGMSFPEALRHLGAKAGVEIPEFRPQPSAIVDAKEALHAMNDLAQRFYAKILWEHADGAGAREYLGKRGIDEMLGKKFGLGYAPDRWDTLAAFLRSRGFSHKQIIDSGLGLKKKEGDGVLDRFRHRLMVPLCDHVGSVVGFTGRVLDVAGKTTSGDGPKYMNSPESAIYHKGRMLYGLHLAKTAIRSKKEVIVVEGNLDVIASHKAGVENIVASSGTALTEEQIRLLSRYATKIIFCLDGDAAGVAAAKRAFALVAQLAEDKNKPLHIDARCLVIPPDAGKDPDDVVRASPERWRELVSQSEPIIEFFFTTALGAFSTAAEHDRTSASKAMIADLIPHIARLPGADERHLYLLRLSDATHVSQSVLEGLVQEARQSPRRSQALTRSPGANVTQPAPDRVATAAEFLFGLLCIDHHVIDEIREHVQPAALPAEPWRRLYSEVYTVYNGADNEGPTHESFFSRLRRHLTVTGRADDITLVDAAVLRTEELVSRLTPALVRRELDQYIALLRDVARRTRRQELESLIRAAELSGNEAALPGLLAEYAALAATGSSSS